MTDDPDLLSETAETLSQTFALEPAETALVEQEKLTLEEVKHFLIEHITRLLDENPALLMNIFYRIDVAEPKVKRILTQSPPELIPAQLADLTIERQLQKVRTRRYYRAQKNTPAGEAE